MTIWKSAIGGAITATAGIGCVATPPALEKARDIMAVASPKSFFIEKRVEPQCLQRWHDPISVSVNGDFSSQQSTILDRALVDFSRASGREVTRRDSLGNNASLKIRLNHFSTLKPDSYKHLCSASIGQNILCRIQSAVMTIPNNLDLVGFEYCVYHEMMHTFGFQGHAWGKDSVLNPKLTRTALTPWDLEAFEFLYDDVTPVR